MKKRKPKLGDWVCAACGGRNIYAHVEYTTYGEAPIVIGNDGRCHTVRWADAIEDEEDVNNSIIFYYCATCHPMARDGYDSEVDLIQLKLEGPFPSQWSAHDIAEWCRKQKKQ